VRIGPDLDYKLGQYIDPWDSEYDPNPVIFRHLFNALNPYKRVIMSHEPTLDEHESMDQRLSFEPSATENQSGLPGLSPMGTTAEEVPSNWQFAEIDSTRIVTVSQRQQPKCDAKFRRTQRTLRSSNELAATYVEEVGVDVTPQRVDGLYPDTSYHGSLTPASPEDQHLTHGSTSTFSPVLYPESSPSESGASVATVSLASMSMDCTCPECGLVFRTAGLQRTHYNRKHNLRYTCEECSAAFGLRKDLERHEQTVHQKQSSSTPAFLCPNVGCATPDKRFTRKDNWRRHVNKCKETVAVRRMRR
jgi:uncharacterized C2H2 Zn-finger protein